MKKHDSITITEYSNGWTIQPSPFNQPIDSSDILLFKNINTLSEFIRNHFSPDNGKDFKEFEYEDDSADS